MEFSSFSSFILFILDCLGLPCYMGSSLVAGSRGFSLVVVPGLLSSSVAQASRCCGFSCCKAQALGCVLPNSCGMSAQQLQLTGSRSQAQ